MKSTQQSLVQLSRMLVQELETMRGTLTDMSQLLHDLRFELVAMQRQAAAQRAPDRIKRNPSRQA